MAPVFEWNPDHDTILEKIATTDNIEGSDWNELRGIIKHRLERNINVFLTTASVPLAPPPFNPQPSTNGGQRLPPFPPKKLAQLHLFDPPVSYMTEAQASESKDAIFEKLDEFEDNPPFTIQRLCELLLEPLRHYKSVGKYLRAVEKSILVTSTHDVFPVSAESDQPFISSSFPPAPSNGDGASHAIQTTFPGSSSVPSSPAFATRRAATPSTPLFSPIPFLHADARSRSKSRSPPPATPPMTPLSLAGDDLPPTEGEEKALGLVDELDDPSPGHMSDKPKPLTVAGGAKPFIGSLEDRFVKSEEKEGGENLEGGIQVKDDEKEKEDSGRKIEEETAMDVVATNTEGETKKEAEAEDKTLFASS